MPARVHGLWQRTRRGRLPQLPGVDARSSLGRLAEGKNAAQLLLTVPSRWR